MEHHIHMVTPTSKDIILDVCRVAEMTQRKSQLRTMKSCKGYTFSQENVFGRLLSGWRSGNETPFTEMNLICVGVETLSCIGLHPVPGGRSLPVAIPCTHATIWWVHETSIILKLVFQNRLEVHRRLYHLKAIRRWMKFLKYPTLANENSKLVALQANIWNFILGLNKCSEVGATTSRNVAAGMRVGVDVFLVVFRIDVFVDVSTVILFCHGVVSRRWSVMGVHDFVCLFVCVATVRWWDNVVLLAEHTGRVDASVTLSRTPVDIALLEVSYVLPHCKVDKGFSCQ